MFDPLEVFLRLGIRGDFSVSWESSVVLVSWVGGTKLVSVNLGVVALVEISYVKLSVHGGTPLSAGRAMITSGSSDASIVMFISLDLIVSSSSLILSCDGRESGVFFICCLS